MFKWLGQVAEYLVNLPRITRIQIAAVSAVLVTLATSPFIDDIYLRYFFQSDTVVVPSLIAGVSGFSMYALGWFSVVGIAGEKPESSVWTRLYVVVSLFSLAAVVVWAAGLVLAAD